MTDPGSASFGDAAGEMANETEVEAPAPQGASASAGQPADSSASEQGVTTQGDVPDTSEEAVDDPSPTDQDGTDQQAEISVAPSAEEQLAERTADLQRLQAEYANYRKRVDRDRQLIAESAAYKALTPVVEVLDTIDRAKEHGELEGGLKTVADQLERVVATAGLVRFGEPGDAFDPNLHEALSHLGADPEVEVTTVKHVAKGGYRLGDRVVRAAQVLVVDPADG